MTEVPSTVQLPPVEQTQPSGVVGNPSAGSTT